MSDQLFDGYPDPEPEPDPYEGMGQTARATARRRERLASGWHPVAPYAVADNGKTCGDCSDLFLKQAGNGAWWKCSMLLRLNGGSADMTKSWPACRAFKPKGDDDA